MRIAFHANEDQAGIAPDDWRRAGRTSRTPVAPGDVIGPRGLALDRDFQAANRDHRADLRAQIDRLDDFARLRVPRRSFLCVFVAWRAWRPAVCFGAWCGVARPAHRS